MTLTLEWRLHVARLKRDEIEAKIEALLEKIGALPDRDKSAGALWEEFQALEARSEEQEKEIFAVLREIREQGGVKKPE